MLEQNPLFVAVASALVGAFAGAMATWFAQKRQDRVRSRGSDERRLLEKVHELETRIVRLETEMDVLDLAGSRKVRSQGGEADV